MPKQFLCSLFGKEGRRVSKASLIQSCLEEHDGREINHLFKRYLQQHYGCYWDRFRELQPEIYEIDYQWFYRYGLSPQAIY